MAKRIRTIVESDIEPQDSNVIWLKDNRYYVFGKNGWEVTNVLPEDIEDLNKDLKIDPNSLEVTSAGLGVKIYKGLYEGINGLHVDLGNGLGYNGNSIVPKLGTGLKLDTTPTGTAIVIDPDAIGTLALKVSTGLEVDSLGYLGVKMAAPLTFDDKDNITIKLGLGLGTSDKQVQIDLSPKAVGTNGLPYELVTKNNPLCFDKGGNLTICLGSSLITSEKDSETGISKLDVCINPEGCLTSDFSVRPGPGIGTDNSRVGIKLARLSSSIIGGSKGSPLTFKDNRLSIHLGSGLTCDENADSSGSPLRILLDDRSLFISETGGLKVQLHPSGGLEAVNSGIKLKTNLTLAQDGIGTETDGTFTVNGTLLYNIFEQDAARPTTRIGHSLEWGTNDPGGEAPLYHKPTTGGPILQVCTAWLRSYLRSVGLTLNTVD